MSQLTSSRNPVFLGFYSVISFFSSFTYIFLIHQHHQPCSLVERGWWAPRNQAELSSPNKEYLISLGVHFRPWPMGEREWLLLKFCSLQVLHLLRASSSSSLPSSTSESCPMRKSLQDPPLKSW